MSEQNQPQEQAPSKIDCAIVVGVREDGGVFIETHGERQNLITIDGLVKYAERYVENEWAKRRKDTEAQQVQAQTESGEQVEVEMTPPVAEPKKRTRKKKLVPDA